MNAAWEELRSLVDDKCLTVGRSYTLSTGRRSEFYFDCKKAMLDGRCLSLIADAFLDEASKLPRFPHAIGGLTMGADFIVAAVIQRAFETGKPLVSGSIVRKEQKQHGSGNKIENELAKGTPIMVVDDVVTTGSSTERRLRRVHRGRIRHRRDRGPRGPGVRRLRDAGARNTIVRLRAIFRKRDFPRIDREMRQRS